MKTYTYRIYQPHYTTVKDTYDVQAESKEEADALIKEYYETGDETPSIEHIDRDQDIIYETLEPTNEKGDIWDEDDTCIYS